MPNRTLLNLTVKESDQTRHYWATRPGLSEETQARILASGILLVPWENRSNGGDTFPAGTTEFALRLKRSLSDQHFEIAVDRENYVELALHADHERWPTMVVSTIFLGVLSSVLGSYIYDMMQKPAPPKTLEMKLIVENKDGKCISIDYTGPPLDALDSVVAQAENCFPGEIGSPPVPSEDVPTLPGGSKEASPQED